METDSDRHFPVLNMRKQIVVSAPSLLECGGCAVGNGLRSPLSYSKYAETDSGFSASPSLNAVRELLTKVNEKADRSVI